TQDMNTLWRDLAGLSSDLVQAVTSELFYFAMIVGAIVGTVVPLILRLYLHDDPDATLVLLLRISAGIRRVLPDFSHTLGGYRYRRWLVLAGVVLIGVTFSRELLLCLVAVGSAVTGFLVGIKLCPVFF
ncbi:hypothetical protein BaRGS_00034104, partial [Batillaria attramentaria]